MPFRPDAASPDSGQSSITARPPPPRVRMFDLAKTVAILGVVFAHAQSPRFFVAEGGGLVPLESLLECVNLVSGMFMLPTIFFASGFLLAHTNGYVRAGGYVRFVARKAARLMGPYVFLTTAAFLLRGAFGHYAARALDFTFAGYVDGLLYPMGGPITLLWFLPALMGSFLLAPLVNRARRMPVWQWAGITAALAAYAGLHLVDPDPLWRFAVEPSGGMAGPLGWLYRAVPAASGEGARYPLLCIPHALYYFAYFWLGALATRYASAWRRLMNTRGVASLAVLAMAAMGFYWSHDNGSETYVRITFLGGPVGTLAMLALANRLARHRTRALDGLGRHSFAIYLLSWFFQQGAVVACARILARTGWEMDSVVYAGTVAALCAAGVGGPVLVSRFAMKWRVPGRFLLGVGG